MRRAELKDHLSGSLNVVGARTFFGLYVNELVYRLSARHERTPEIFDLYHQFMEALKLESFQVRFLTGFEVQFLKALGFAIDLGRADGGEQLVKTNERYRFDPEVGLSPIRAAHFRGWNSSWHCPTQISIHRKPCLDRSLIV